MSQLISVYDNLNKTLIKDCREIILSNHVVDDNGGFVLESNPHRIHIMSITDAFYLESIMIHEMAHVFDMVNKISSSKIYIDLANKFPFLGFPLDKSDNHYYAEHFAYSIELLFSDHVSLDEKTIYLYKLLGIIK